MINDLNTRIARAKELLKTVKHAAMATVNADGSPHNTPFLFMHHPELSHVYWGSHSESVHSQNVIRTGQIYVVLYDAIERGGLYISAENGHTLDGEELAKALAVHNQVRSLYGQPPIDIGYYVGSSPRRLWAAKISHFWVNTTERDSAGLLIKDGRHEISAGDLL